MQFEPDHWRQRSWRRFERQIRAGKPQEMAELAWTVELVHINNLSKIIDWCYEHRLDVEFTSKQNGLYDSETRKISIASTAGPLRQVVYLLHECGHFLLEKNVEDPRYVNGYPMINEVKRESFRNRLACLEEELEAWHRGWNLSERLQLNIDREDFDVIRVECVKSYCDWVSNKKK